MKKDLTKKICYIGVLTALYVIFSAFLKVNLIGNIQLDFGYLAFAIALCEFGIYGAPVGIIGCVIESMLFSAYGFSVSWMVANTIIGIGCGLLFMKVKKIGWRIVIIIIFAALGLLGAKTIIECSLYSIPILVKIPKNAVAFGVDTAMMIIGCGFYEKIKDKIMKKKK